MPNSAVFIVDDDPAILALATTALSGHCRSVHRFASAEDFLNAFKEEERRPRCLVVDLELPGMGGLDLQAKLCEQLIRIPIIFISGRAEMKSVVQAMKLGAVDFLEKPIDKDQLVTCVTKALEAERESIRQRSKRADFHARLETLTPREVLELLARGKATKEIAALLDIRPKTVFVHRARAMEKMAVESLVELSLLMVGESDSSNEQLRA